MRSRREWRIVPLVGLLAMAAGAGAVVLVLALQDRPPAPAPPPVTDRGDEAGDIAPEPAPGPGHDRPVADATTTADDRPPQLWAVVVGIEIYANDIPTCNGATADARAVRDWLVGQGGWPGDHVMLMVDSGAEFPRPDLDPDVGLRPLRSNLAWALEEWLPSRAAPEDVVVVYFAGQAAHVAAGPDAPEWQADGRSFLLPIEARSTAIGRDGLELDEALEPLAARQDNPIVCWLDTSLDGRGRPAVLPDDGDGAADDPPSGIDWLNRLTRWPGLSAWLAADGAVAGESPEPGRHSPFTAALLAGLDAGGPAGSLDACLARMQADADLRAQGFRTRGNLIGGLGLRSGAMARRVPSGPRELVLQQGHGTAITDLRFTPDGAWLISAADGEASVKVWDFEADRVLRTIAQATNGVTALAVRPERRLLVVGDGNGYLHSFDLDRDFRRGPPAPPNLGGAVADLAILPGGDHVVALFNDEVTGDSPAFLRPIDALSARGIQLARNATAIIPAPPGADWGFALADAEDRRIRLYDPDGRAITSIAAPEGHIDAANAAASGHLLAVADDRGGLVVHDTTTWAERLRDDLGAGADRLALSTSGVLAVSSGRTLRVFDLRGEAPVERPAIPLDRPIAAMASSPDGRWLAACLNFEADTGAPPLLWRLDGPDGTPEPVALADDRPAAEADDARRDPGSPASLAFRPDSSVLVAGDTAGGLRRWSLDRASAGVYQPPRRGQVRAVSVAGDGSALLQITRDGTALFWDLRDGRGPQAVPGAWTSGVLLPPIAGGDGPRLAMTTKATEAAGEVAFVDPRTGRRLMGVGPPLDADGEVIPNVSFTGLVASADGRRLAAFTPDDQLAAVWDAETGAAVAVLDGCHLPPRSVDLSADGRLLLTSGDDGARLWELADGTLDALERAAVGVLDDDGAVIPVTSARIRPDPEGGDGPIRAVLGCQDGQLRLWTEGENGEEAPRLDRLVGSVKAMAFSGDGRWLAAGGVDRLIRLWDMGSAPIPMPTFPAMGPEASSLGVGGSHSEQVNALAFVRDYPIFVSGGDDCLVRLWRADADGGRLLGSGSTDQDSGRWIVYTPDGLFDCSPKGADRVAWRWGDGLVPLGSYPASHRVFGLAGRLCVGDVPPVPGAIARPPSLTIDGPADRVVFDRDVELAIRLDRPDPGSLRVYQDGVPVLAASSNDEADAPDDDEPPRLRPDPENPRRWLARVRLHSGPNRFYAMAGPTAGDEEDDATAAGPDGHSEELEIVYGGADPDEPGLVHVIALGVGDYQVRERALRFAGRDAETFGRFVNEQGAADGGTLGRCHILADRNVTRAAIDTAFEDVRQAVEGRPQDTVVLFLAGHADALGPDGRERFFLILPDFPFPGPEATRDRAEQVAFENRGELLPFGAIYGHLLHLDALHRLVVVDACQAEAIRDDDSVRRVQELVDGAAFEARTSYYLAASRQDVPAGESPELGHGLLTYAMLKGLGMPPGAGPGRLPRVSDLPTLDELPNADLAPADGFVTTVELHAFVDRALPLLARRFPALALRAGVDGGPGPTEFVRPTVGIADAGFTLLRVPEGREAPPVAADD